jgi:hypothetical protein
MTENRQCIPKEQCKDRKLYRIHSRNLLFGVFRATTGGFLGLREKFDRVYVFEEYHYDNGPPYGTVRPIEELPEELPEGIQNEVDLGAKCSKCGRDSEYIDWPEGGEREITLQSGETRMVPGLWKHLDGTRCEDMYGHTKDNYALDKWLQEMEEKYYKGRQTCGS